MHRLADNHYEPASLSSLCVRTVIYSLFEVGKFRIESMLNFLDYSTHTINNNSIKDVDFFETYRNTYQDAMDLCLLNYMENELGQIQLGRYLSKFVTNDFALFMIHFRASISMFSWKWCLSVDKYRYISLNNTFYQALNTRYKFAVPSEILPAFVELVIHSAGMRSQRRIFARINSTFKRIKILHVHGGVTDLYTCKFGKTKQRTKKPLRYHRLYISGQLIKDDDTPESLNLDPDNVHYVQIGK